MSSNNWPLDQRLRIERHVADGAPCAVEMRREGQPVHAAGRAGQDGRRAPHPQADPQRAEGGAHGLRLVVRATRDSRRHQLVHHGRLAGLARRALARRGRATRAVHQTWPPERPSRSSAMAGGRGERHAGHHRASPHPDPLPQAGEGREAVVHDRHHTPSYTTSSDGPGHGDRTGAHVFHRRRLQHDVATDRIALEQAQQRVVRQAAPGRTGGASATCCANFSNIGAHWPPGTPTIS